jgi:hypothetical protein
MILALSKAQISYYLTPGVFNAPPWKGARRQLFIFISKDNPSGWLGTVHPVSVVLKVAELGCYAFINENKCQANIIILGQGTLPFSCIHQLPVCGPICQIKLPYLTTRMHSLGLLRLPGQRIATLPEFCLICQA